MARSKVPSDPSMSPELRRFLDEISRQSVATDLDINSIIAVTGAFDEIEIDGKTPFLQGGEADEGLDHNFVDHGTVSSGTLTIDPINGFFQKVINDGAFALSPVSGRGGSCILHITNGATPGAVTFTGWIKKYPSGTIDAVTGNKFAVTMYFYDTDGADYAIQARQ